MKINEIFFSIQGEGLLVGTPTIFLRTAGCNLRCSYCDTTYAYEEGHEMGIRDILDALERFPCSFVCITGGEPLLQKDLLTLINHLIQKKYMVCLETNGSKDVKVLVGKKSVVVSLDIKCPSSGSHQQMRPQNISYLTKKDQLKFIIKSKVDYEYAKKMIAQYNPKCTVFFQPVWGTSAKKLASWILKDGLPVRLSLQLHKFMWGTKRGV